MTELQESRKPGDANGLSIVARMVVLVGRVALNISKPVVVALDAYYASKVAWATAEQYVSESGEQLVSIVTRGQKNTVAYELPQALERAGRGRPRKYGTKIALRDLFNNLDVFTQTTMTMYDKETKVLYLCRDLLWRPVGKLVRFVLVYSNESPCILMTSDLGMPPEEVIRNYGVRFKIETSFSEQKNDMGGFAYHFWSKSLPKRSKWTKTEMPSESTDVERVKKTVQAISTFVSLNTIATGIMMLMAFEHSREIWTAHPGWLRTIRSPFPTVATVKLTLAADFHAMLPFISDLPSFSFIPERLRIGSGFRKIA